MKKKEKYKMIEDENIMDSYRVKCVLPELEKLKRFFEDLYNSQRNQKSVVGSLGNQGKFFGNAIEHNSFDIPLSAMKLIYEYNKENIEKRIASLRDLEAKYNRKSNNNI